MKPLYGALLLLSTMGACAQPTDAMSVWWTSDFNGSLAPDFAQVRSLVMEKRCTEASEVVNRAYSRGRMGPELAYYGYAAVAIECEGRREEGVAHLRYAARYWSPPAIRMLKLMGQPIPEPDMHAARERALRGASLAAARPPTPTPPQPLAPVGEAMVSHPPPTQASAGGLDGLLGVLEDLAGLLVIGAGAYQGAKAGAFDSSPRWTPSPSFPVGPTLLQQEEAARRGAQRALDDARSRELAPPPRPVDMDERTRCFANRVTDQFINVHCR